MIRVREKSLYTLERKKTMSDTVKKAEALFASLPFLDKKSSGTFDCREECYMKLYENTTAQDYEAYLSSLTAAGFALLQRTEMNGNLSAALAKDTAVTLCYTPCDESLRVTVCAKNNFPALTPVKTVPDGKTVFYAFENDHALIDCGMCLLVQCADNSFFIVDSGHYFQFNDNDRLYKFMRERTPAGQKVVVNGWFITHTHTDHVSKLMDFLKYNTDDVIIEGVYQNLLPLEHPNDFGNHEEKEIAARLYELLDGYPAPVYKLHSGMRFYVRELAFDVLYTHEDSYPAIIEDFNDSSTVLMMTAHGSKVFIPGDAAVYASEVLEKRYGTSLKCDVVQIAHHGHTGLSEHCYELLAADTAIFPVTRVMFEQDIKRHAADRKAIELASRYFITSDGTVCVPLPYEKDAVYTLPDESTEDFEKIKRLWRYDYPEEYKKYIYDTFLKNGGSPEKLLIPSSQTGWIEPKPWIEGC